MTAIVKVKSVGAKKNKKSKKNKKREILCLANSRKPGGRCVAGLLPDGIYREADVKPVMDRLVDERKVDQVSTGRSYADRVFRLAEPQLF